MQWITDKSRSEAMTAEAYCIRWAKHPTRGLFYNAWAPSGAHLEASHDIAKVKAACEMHVQATVTSP